jgi:hypothetical protein
VKLYAKTIRDITIDRVVELGFSGVSIWNLQNRIESAYYVTSAHTYVVKKESTK